MKKKVFQTPLVLSLLLCSSLTPVIKASETSTTSSSAIVANSSSTDASTSTSSTLPSGSTVSNNSGQPASSSLTTSNSSTATSVGASSSNISSTSTTSTSSATPSSSKLPSSTSSSSLPSSSTSSTVAEKEETQPGLSSTDRQQESNLERVGSLEKIIGVDNRFKVTATQSYPYRTVVYLESIYVNGIGMGTGVLIGPDTILTAAHNVYDIEIGSFAKSITAYPAKSGNTNPFGSYEAKDYYILRNYKFAGDWEYDIAVIKLKRPVPSTVGYVTPVTSVALNNRIQIPGYPLPRSYAYSMYTMYGSVTEVETDLIAYKVDTEAGQSGSPVLNDKNQVVGIHIVGTDNFNIARRVQADTIRLIDRARYERSPNLEITSYSESWRRETQRLYHPGIQRHLYTQNLDEAAYLATVGWNYEGVKFKTAATGKPVYRMYHSGTREHLYTTSSHERDVLRTRGWRYEGTAWNSGGKTPIYRLYHEGLQVHLYTADKNESDTLRKRGWKYEGVSFYTQ